MINQEEPPLAHIARIFRDWCFVGLRSNEILSIPFTRAHLCGAGMQFHDISNEHHICRFNETRELDGIVNLFHGADLRDNRRYGNKKEVK